MSLSVKDMAASREFYSKLGFEMTGGDGENWTIMVGPSAVIGLFSGMFEGNILTFNPGWVGAGAPADEFADIRDLASQLREAGLDVNDDTTGESDSGPASFALVDPDGNAILVDQHV